VAAVAAGEAPFSSIFARTGAVRDDIAGIPQVCAEERRDGVLFKYPYHRKEGTVAKQCCSVSEI